MAPTICSDKSKQQNLRVSHKEPRRHRQLNRHLSLAHATPQASSTLIGYMSSNPRPTHGVPGHFPFPHLTEESNAESSEFTDIRRDQREESSLDHQNFASHVRSTLKRSSSPASDACSAQYSDDFMLEDDEDDQRLFPYDTDNDDNNSMSSSVLSSDIHSTDETNDFRQDDEGYFSNKSLLQQTVLEMPLQKQKLLEAKAEMMADDGKESEKYRNGLLSIALKTIKLVQRNKILQERLAQLQVETSEFIESVMANPENQHFREKLQQSQKQKS